MYYSHKPSEIILKVLYTLLPPLKKSQDTSEI